MENRAYALIVGLFVIVLGAAMVGGLWWFSGGTEATREFLVLSRHTVTGLNPQAAVRFRGVRVGKVVNVDLHESGEVRVLIRVAADTPVTRGTTARVGMVGIAGQGFLQLEDDGHDPVGLLPKGIGDTPTINMGRGLMEEVTESGRDILGRLREATGKVDRVLNDENVERIGRTLENLAASSEQLRRSLAQTNALVADVRRFSSTENAERLAATLDQIQGMSRQLTPAVEDFRRALGKVDAAAARIDKVGADVQSGLTGETLPKLNQLSAELQGSAQQLARVLDDVQRSPQILLMGKQTPVTGPGETATAKP